MEDGVSYSNIIFEVLGFWLLIILVVFFLLRGILRGNKQKRDEKIMELEEKIVQLEKKIDKNN